MLPLSADAIRASFINASRKEAASLTLPADFNTLDWERLDYLGWRDPKLERRAYVVVPTLDGRIVGVLLRHPGTAVRRLAQCSWCADTSIPNPVVLYSAKRSGESGRLGNAVGADMRVTAPMSSFAPKDTIYAAVSTATSDPAAIKHLQGSSWHGAAIAYLGVTLEVVELPQDVVLRILAAQKRQYR